MKPILNKKKYSKSIDWKKYFKNNDLFNIPYDPSWTILFSKLHANEKFTKLNKKLKKITKENKNIYPKPEYVFNTFMITRASEVKVVFIGQDPYFNTENYKNKQVPQAMGLSFSVPKGIRIPPSLRNIFKEIDRTTENISKTQKRTNGDLTEWARQGVLLLNTALTVFEGKTGSHKKIWNDFTKYILNYINKECEPIVCMLWGRDAEKYKELINNTKHYILISGHPSPLNRTNPFIGNNHFILCNNKLKEWEKPQIEWVNTKLNLI